MSKERKDKFQTYKNYRIKVQYNENTKKYCASLSSLSDDVEYLFEMLLDENFQDAKSAFKKAMTIIDNHVWKFIFEKNESKLYIRLCFDNSWECRVENHEIIQIKKTTKEDVIFCGKSIIENYWKKIAVYFKIGIYVCVNESNMYMCKVGNKILGKEFDNYLSALMTGIKEADIMLQK